MQTPSDRSNKTGHYRLACQNIIWDEERIAKRDYTVQAISEAGYEGIEIGARFLDLDHPGEFKAVLDAHRVHLVSIHIGWNPFLDSKPGTERPPVTEEVERVIQFAKVTGTKFVNISGKDDDAQLKSGIASLNQIGKTCHDNGMVLCYHNHGWEIRDDARILREIIDQTDPSLVSFCPDLGWVRKLTPDFDGILKLLSPRVRLVHFKDYVADGLDCLDNETEFGQGILDFDAAFRALRDHVRPDLWVIAEQWKSTVNHLSPEEAIRRNYQFLKNYCDANR